MKNDGWYDSFLDALSIKYPKKTQLIQELMDLLCIGQEAAYRRLRKDVIFHAYEIAKIASEWNVSLDKIIDVAPGKISFQMQLVDYFDLSNQDEYLFQSIIEDILYTSDFPETEYMDTCNKLPRSLFAGYNYLNQFYLFRGFSNTITGEKSVPFSEVLIPEKSRRLTENFYQAVKQIPNTNFILDYRLFDNLISDVRFFYSVRLITDEEKKFIKNDLYALLDYLSEVASYGYYPETKNKVSFYISQLSVDTNYSYIITDKANVCFVRAFDRYEIHTHNEEMIERFKTMMKFRKRTSIQISEVDAKRRIDYFEKQRQVVESL